MSVKVNVCVSVSVNVCLCVYFVGMVGTKKGGRVCTSAKNYHAIPNEMYTTVMCVGVAFVCTMTMKAEIFIRGGKN